MDYNIFVNVYTKEAQDNIGLRFDAPKRENWTYKKYIKHVSIRDKVIRGKYMPQDTENIMSVYEIITTVIAVIALLQPWIIKFYNHFLKKICVSFIPSAQIKLYYNRSGAYVYLGGVIESKNQAALGKDISVKVIRQNDKAELNFRLLQTGIYIYLLTSFCSITFLPNNVIACIGHLLMQR